MNIEFLANELLLDIFEYFNAIEILHSFHQLNIRFNTLIYIHLQKCPLDFRSIYKQDFDNICQNHLPFITNYIISLHLSNEDDTPNQLNLFFLYNYDFKKFINLQSLSLYQIYSIDLINAILSNCSNLIYLNLNKCHFNDNNIEQKQIYMNTIWSLSKLQYCYLNEFYPLLLTINSLSMKKLSLENNSLLFNSLIFLYHYTSNLQILNIKIRDLSSYDELISFNISQLTIDFSGEINFLKNFPNLSKLIIKISDIYINGYQWENLINNHLKKLKIFRLLMIYQFNQIEKSLDEEFEELFQSFQTKFWIEIHQWFIQFHYNSEHQFVHLYTLPYSFKKFFNYNINISKSTCLINENFRLFNYVKKLICENDLINLSLKFFNINYLEIGFPFNDNIWLIIPNFKRLKSLEILSNIHSNEFDQSIIHLRKILEQSINLYSLTIDYLIISQLSILKLLNNKSIRRLDLMMNDGHFYGSECISLIESFLGNQCEVLLINIENRSIIFDLIKHFSKLRALIIQCQDDQWDDSNESFLNEDELIQWLTYHLPPNCSISRDENEISAIQLWIR